MPRGLEPMISAEAAANALPRWVQRLAVATAAGTFLLICAGGLVKSKEAGLSVPDWPLSWGMPEGAVALVLASVTLVLGAAWCFWPTRLLAAGAIFAGLSLAVTYYTYGPKNWYLVDTIRAEHSHRLIAGTVGFMTAILAAALWRYDTLNPDPAAEMSRL